MTGDNPSVLYVPLAQSDAPEGPALIVKGAAAPPPMPAVRALVRELDARVAIGRATTLDAVVAGAVAEPLRLRFFLSILGGLALVIGAVGIYSVVSYWSPAGARNSACVWRWARRRVASCRRS